MTSMSELRSDVDQRPVVTAVPALADAGNWAETLAQLAIRSLIVWVLAILVIVSQVLYPGFLDLQNVYNLLSQNAPVGLIAVGMTFVMVAGGFDLSVGPMYAAGAVLYAGLSKMASLPLPVAAFATILFGLLGGSANGLLITRLRVNPFVATLGSSSIITGLAFLYSHSAPIMVDRPEFTAFGTASWLGVPISVEVLFAAFVVGAVVLAKTVYGRSLYAVGGNLEAARLAGLRVDWLRLSTYALVGGLATLAGIIIASRLSIGQADIASTMSLDAIAIVIIGGTSLFGGSGAVWRTAVGLLILAVLTNLFDALALDTNFQSVIKGMIVIGAVALDVWRERRFL